MFDKNYLWLKDNTIFLTKTGSFSYGTNIEGSDHDFKGIAFAKKDHYFGFNFDFNQYTLNDPDLTIFEFQKVIKLLADGNPNSLELLYTDESDHVFVSKLGQKLLDFRENFLSKALKERFLGYSKAQAYRLKLHRKHILNGEPKKPNRKDFGLPEKLSIPTNQYEAVSAQLKKQVDQWNPDFDPFSEAQKIWLQSKFVDMLSEINITQDTLWMAAARKLGYSDNFIEILNKEKQFEAEQAYFEKYQDWKKNRNPKRAALEAKSGMDCYADDTEFLTNDGWKKYDNISDSDLLGTFNKETFKLEFQKFNNRFDSNYTGYMHNLVGYHMNISITANHNMFIKEISRKSKKEKGDWKLLNVSSVPDTFNIIQTINPNTNNSLKELENLPGNISKEDYLKLMGWYLSDGHAVFRVNKKRGKFLKEIIISQKKYGKLYNDMDIFAKKYNCLLRDYQKNNAAKTIESRLIINKQWINKLLKDCDCLKNKHIPKYMLEASVNDQKTLIDALLGGDGTKRKFEETYIYYSSLEKLANDVQILAFRAGYLTSLYGPYLYKKNTDKQTIIYQVFINKNPNQTKQIVRSNSIKKEYVDNKRVVCFSVPNSTLITRRDGHIALQGNCKHAMHCIRLCRMCLEILETGKVLVKRPDAEELIAIRTGSKDYSYDQFVDEVSSLETKIKLAYDKSMLPKEVNSKKINDFSINLTEEFFYGYNIYMDMP